MIQLTCVLLILFFSHNAANAVTPIPVITFVANAETMGNSIDISSMDYFNGVQHPQLSLIIPYLSCLHLKSEVLDWQDPSIDWSSKNKIVLGPIWGYIKTIDKFREWLDGLQSQQVKMINSPLFLKWNMDKHYLLDLEKANFQVKHLYATLLLYLEDLNIPHPHYLRVDGVMVGHKFVIMELEGIEPYLEMQEAIDNAPSNNVIQTYANSILK